MPCLGERDNIMTGFIEVEAIVRYWEDSSVNGVEDERGTLIPCREGNMWHIVIDTYVGRIKDWIIGTTAQIHYKVCDAIEVWLLNEDSFRTYKYNVGYVPAFLSIGENGYGDYIIMDIDENGMIDGWKRPMFKKSEFTNLHELITDYIE